MGIGLERPQKSQLTEINTAVILAIGLAEETGGFGQGIEDSCELNAHVGRDAIFFAQTFQPGNSSMEIYYWSPVGETQSAMLALRVYQGMYLGGGKFSALGEGGLNEKLFKYWHKNPLWPRKIKIMDFCLKI